MGLTVEVTIYQLFWSVIVPKFTGEYLKKANITYEILFRNDSLKKKGGTGLMSEDIQVFVNEND